MDRAKCRALKAELAKQPEPPEVAAERFFDGNDDLGSIGCNLAPHPGLGVFRERLTGLLRRPDVEAVYLRIAEVDPGEGCWPFADTALVVGGILLADLTQTVRSLRPDRVERAE